MNRTFLIALLLFTSELLFAKTNDGTIKGHIKLTGAPPGNPVIHMGADPKCNQLNTGKRPVQEIVAVDIKGNLANVFVRLQGNFPPSPPPKTPVVIDQRGCQYSPRVTGLQLGQELQIKNDDALAHNVYSRSGNANRFNVSQPGAGSVDSVKPKEEEVMLRIGCQIHRWMTAYVGVVKNPYFAVSSKDGRFEISHVPPGTYTIQAWQEQFGFISKSIKVSPGRVQEIELVYTGKEQNLAK